MSHFTTTTRDHYRDPRTQQPYPAQKPNQEARERRRSKQYAKCPTAQPEPQDEAATIGEIHHAESSISYTPGKKSKYDKSAMRHSAEDLVANHYEWQKFDTTDDHDNILDLEDQIRATVYGQCIGDAIGLLTEFMSKRDAFQHYGKYSSSLELEDKIEDRHRRRWAKGDWTDDSDQMILIMQSLTDNKGEVLGKDFAKRLLNWSRYGFEELSDTCGLGIGRTTYTTITRRNFKSEPIKASKETWKESGEKVAPNGGVMRTSILGIHEFWDLDKVQRNAKEICKTTHFDPRCQASVVAVCVAIALMLQRKPPYFNCTTNEYDVERIIDKCYDCASSLLIGSYQKSELQRCLKCSDIEVLRLDEDRAIGYTFKCLGAGFWALKQTDFRTALTEIVMNGGDADTNGAVAGALLGCKLQKTSRLPASWYNNLKHRQWLNEQIAGYLKVFRGMYRKK